MEVIEHPSPNFDSREGVAIEHLVLHYTGMKTGAEALARLCDAQAKVSSHYLIEEDGRIFKLVDEADRAWHAGVSHWHKQYGINASSIGIEIVNPGHEWGYHPFPEVQMHSVIALCKAILARHEKIIPHHVIGHSDIAFMRKEDPGELFDWKRLAEEGIGLWHDDPAPKKVPWLLKEGDAGEGVRQLQDKLAFFGYDMPVDGLFGLVSRKGVKAFQRHFRPSLVNGVWDGECEARLDKLLKKL